MDSVHRRSHILVAAAVVAVTALLVWVGEGLNPWWPATWLAPLPLLWYSLRSRWWTSAAVGALGFMLGFMSLLKYFLLQGMPFGAWLGSFGTLALMVAIGALLFRLLVLRGALCSGLAALPALWVSVDWLRFCYTPHGTSADLAYTQLQCLPFLQLASVTGPWGMSFLLLLVPGAIAIVHHLWHRDRRRALQIGLTVASLVVVVIVFGITRLTLQASAASLRVGLISSDAGDGHGVADSGAPAARLFDDYAARARQLALAGALVVVMPEKIAVVSDEARTDSSVLQPVADATGAVLVAGEVRLSSDSIRRYNRAVLFAPHSIAVGYDKEHMLPPFESKLTPGTDKLMAMHHGVKLGVAICKDMDFTTLGRDYGARGAQVMLVPAWDFDLDRSWHGHMAIMRGVESGFSIVRAAKDGNLTVSDDRGRILAETRSDAAPFATLLVDVPARHSWTLFQAWGDWFAWIAVACLAVVSIRAAMMAGRKPIEAPAIPERS